jgi:alpha-ketoglutarate-dependent taurine dioxygenase
MPYDVTPSGTTLGATMAGLDLARLSEPELDAVIHTLGRYGVVRFPDQSLSAADLLALESWQRVGANVRGGVVEDAGHWIPEEKPEWATEEILKFFGEADLKT